MAIAAVERLIATPLSSPIEETLSLASTIIAIPDQVSCDLAGEVVILALGSGMYFGLDTVGADVWQMIQEACTVESVRDRLLDLYEVDSKTCEADLLDLLSQMLEQKLISIVAP